MAKSILIIEDYADTLKLLQVIFEKEGYEVRTAETGEQALEIISKRMFDLILLDIMLPRIDGFEVCRRIKSNPLTRNTPVIAITAFDVPDIIKRCTAAGADDTLLKPFDRTDLLNMVKKHIKE